MTHHLGYEKHDYQGKATKDHLDDFLTDLPDNSQTTETTSKPICKQDNNSTPQTKPAVKSKKVMLAYGTTSKTVRTVFGELQLDIPRDRNGRFDPLFIRKHDRTFARL